MTRPPLPPITPEDPLDGRTECETCGRYTWPVIHSCKGVALTEKAKARRAAR